MPEGLEAEIWRRDAERLVGRPIARVELDERTVDPGVRAVVGERVTGVGRHGKVVLIETTGPTLGLRFGMTGRLEVDGSATIEQLAYASGADRAAWDRLVLWTHESERPALRLNDPRRLGRVEVDPDLSGLGPDVLGLDAPGVTSALRGRRRSAKAALMDQSVLAGLGNLCVDEVLFAGGVAPVRRLDELTSSELRRLGNAVVRRLPAMLAAGGSTEGVLDPDRRRELGRCPRRGCGGELVRQRLGGRTTVWCPTHQADR